MKDIQIIYSYMDETNGGAQESADITDLITELSIKTTLEAQPSVLNMTAIGDGFEFILGSLIKITSGSKDIFDGFIFSVTTSKAKTVQITVYDVLRYLKGKDTYLISKDETASDIFKKVCKRLELETGTIDEACQILQSKSMVRFHADVISLKFNKKDLGSLFSLKTPPSTTHCAKKSKAISCQSFKGDWIHFKLYQTEQGILSVA